MGRGWGAVLLLCAMAEGAAANSGDLYERLWPDTPNSNRLTLSQQITDQLTELGNTFGHHVNTLSNETIALDFDGRKRRAKFRLGLAEGHDRYLTFKVAGDVHFTQGRARASIQVEIGVGERVLHLELPDVEMTAAEYRGDRGVALVMPIYKREF